MDLGALWFVASVRTAWLLALAKRLDLNTKTLGILISQLANSKVVVGAQIDDVASMSM